MRQITRLILGFCLLGLIGCGNLSKPGAMDRVMSLNAFASSATKRDFYDGQYYSDHKTAKQRLEVDFAQVQAQTHAPSNPDQ